MQISGNGDNSLSSQQYQQLGSHIPHAGGSWGITKETEDGMASQLLTEGRHWGVNCVQLFLEGAAVKFCRFSQSQTTMLSGRHCQNSDMFKNLLADTGRTKISF